MGKGVGDDFRDGKVTLPVILAYASGSEEERAFWRRRWRAAARKRPIWLTATACLRDSGALDDTFERARHYGQRAIDALGPVPAGRAKAALIEAVEFAIARAY
jgi:octaprenyl-diphosphate synthase